MADILAKLPDFDELWDYGDPEGSENAFRKLAAAHPEDEARSWRLQLRTQIARARGLQRRFDEAEELLDELEEDLGEGDSLARLRLLLERGRVRRSSGEVAESTPFFRDAWESAQRLGEDGFAVDAAHMLAIVVEGEAGLEWHEKARKLAATSSDPRANRWLPSLANNLGWTYHGLDRFEDALGCFEQALQLREESGDESSIRVAMWCVGRCLRSLDRASEALEVQMQLLDEHEEIGEPSGYVYEELGELLWEKGERDDARPHFRRASEILGKDEWLQAEEPERLDRLKRLAGDK